MEEEEGERSRSAVVVAEKGEERDWEEDGEGLNWGS